VEYPGAPWGLVGLHLWVGGEQGMEIDKGEEDNKGFLHILEDVGGFHT
jgi:hypothetical protein